MNTPSITTIINGQDQQIKNIMSDYGTVERAQPWDGVDGLTYDIFRTRGDDASSMLLEFLATNTSVEWSQVKLGIGGDSGLNYLTTSHETGKEKAMTHLINSQLLNGTPSGSMYTATLGTQTTLPDSRRIMTSIILGTSALQEN